MSYADLVKLAQKDEAIALALHDIASACADAYDMEIGDASMAKVIQAFAGARSGDLCFFADLNTGNLALFSARNVSALDTRDMPIGVRPNSDGVLWDVLMDAPYEGEEVADS